MSNKRVTGSRSSQGQRKLFRRRTTCANQEKFHIDSLGSFKMKPSFEPYHFSTNRPLMGACCACLPRSKQFKDFFTSDMRDMGIRNILDLQSEVINSNYLARCFPVETFTLRRPLFDKYPDVSLLVLSSPRILSAIEALVSKQRKHLAVADSNDLAKQINHLEKNAWKIIKKMRANVSCVFIKFTAWFLHKFLGRFLESVQISRAQIKMIKEASEKGVPMIYLPLHRSHLDYILVTLILWNYDIRAPYVAAGDNMDIPIFNIFLRLLGGFFIRRRLDIASGQKDILYRAILHEYMSKLLTAGESLEFFIEGGRSRSGRSVIPKGGLLSVVVEACNDGDIPDAYIVPTSFSYEKIIDGNFSKEQMGEPKKAESFLGALWAIVRVVAGNYGSIRVDFAQPFSLKEFLEFTKKNPYHPLTSSPVVPNRSQIDCGNSYPNFSQTLLSTDVEAEKTRMSVKALADHTVYTSGRCTAPMSTHVVPFLLLTKYRKGVYLRELSRAVLWIVRELQAIDVDVGFCGQSEAVVLYAHKLLGDKLISKLWDSENNDFRLTPNLSLSTLFELSYYANHLTSHFALDSILGTAILSVCNVSFYQLLSTTQLQKKTTTRETIMEIAEELCAIIHNDFIFIPPCYDIYQKLSEILESFVDKEIVSFEENQQNDFTLAGKNRQWADRVALALGEDDSPDMYPQQQKLIINIDKTDVRERLHFLASVIGPILESHLLVANYVLDELSSEMTESSFFRNLGKQARKRVAEESAMFDESCAMVNLKSAVKSFQDLEILYIYKCANLSMIGFSEQIDARNTMEQFNNTLQSCLG